MNKKKKYSFLIKPLFVLLDLLILNSILFIFEDKHYLNLKFAFYVNLLWLILAYFNGFYNIKRTTQELRIITLLFGQLFIFSLSFFAYFSLFTEGVIIPKQFNVLISIIIIISTNKFVTNYLLKFYRKLGKNYRKVVIIGYDNSTKEVIRFFNSSENYGYRLIGYFSDKETDDDKFNLGNVDIESVKEFLAVEYIDEIYLTLYAFNQEKIKNLIWFAKANDVSVKLLPKAKDLFIKNLTLEYYETIPVFSVKELPFELAEVRFIKRGFDIIFSSLIIILLLSWLYPIIWILIKLESKGPAIFKQQREGLNGKSFNCYKFRSMKINNESGVRSAQKNDDRITKIGKFIRKTSIDELPQFFNVVKGNMSVVGPRPHMTKQSKGFEDRIENYIKRYAVKPGITGLAQISGYRGEIQKKADIENRIRLDVFYIEKWSFLLDVKIIFMTVFNVFKGEEKAY